MARGASLALATRHAAAATQAGSSPQPRSAATAAATVNPVTGPSSTATTSTTSTTVIGMRRTEITMTSTDRHTRQRAAVGAIMAALDEFRTAQDVHALLRERGEAIAEGLKGSVTMGNGQFCTKPGVVMAFDDPAFDKFTEKLKGPAPVPPPRRPSRLHAASPPPPDLSHGLAPSQQVSELLAAARGGPRRKSGLALVAVNTRPAALSRAEE